METEHSDSRPSDGSSAGSGPPPAPEVRPVDVDGVRATTTGTILWVVALLLLLPFQQTLRDEGRSWWFGVCAVGIGLGLAGIAYTRRRRARLRSED